jgi:hypothetical protein
MGWKNKVWEQSDFSATSPAKSDEQVRWRMAQLQDENDEF